MKRFIISLLISMMFLTGCNDRNNTTLTFKGESNYWTADYTQKSTETWSKDSSGKLDYENTASKRLSLKYKGTDLSKIGLVKYSYDTGIGGGSGETSLDKNGYLIIGDSSGKNVNLTSSDSVIVVRVEWKGMKENISLTIK